jgi:hypothetical protein
VQSPHLKIIADAAKRNLAPMGLTRKGRSRVWLDDRGWYVTVVEFQPSGFSKGSYLNVGAHFLWSWSGSTSFDLGYRVNGFVTFAGNENFATEIERLAVAAVKEVERLRTVLVSPTVVAKIIPSNPNASSWASYHQAVSLALSGDADASAKLFGALAQPAREYYATESHKAYEVDRAAKCELLRRKIQDPTAFRHAIVELIGVQRKSLHLNERTDVGI